VRPVVGLAITLALHALVFAQAFTQLGAIMDKADPRAREQQITVLYLRPREPEKSAPDPEPPAAVAEAPAVPLPTIPVPEVESVVAPIAPRQMASMAAQAAPTAEEWAFASTYKLKNSKGYRHTWGQQVRSMMGTAVEGPDQGMVEFRIEIAPDGSLTQLETLWSTSAVAERLARQAIGSMPRWPSTPTGKPLIFEKTISFSPFASDDPPRSTRTTACPTRRCSAILLPGTASLPACRCRPSRSRSRIPRRWRIASSTCRRIRSRQRAHAIGG
jgi:hypothetical protein